MSYRFLSIQSTEAVQLFQAFEKDDFDGMMAALGEYQACPEMRVVHPRPDRRLADYPFVIHAAAFYGAVSCFRYLIQLCNVTVHDDRGRELCQFAAYSGSVTIFDIMLENKVPIDATGVNFMRPFLIAAKYGHTDLCKWLFANGCQYECFNKSGQNAMDLAGEGCHTETYRFLLRIGLSHHVPNGANGNVWYKSLVRPGNQEFLQMLIDCEVPHFQDSVGAWPIHYAARAGRVDILQKFCESGVDVNVGDNEGETPLMSAVRTGTTEPVSILINAKANVNAQTKSGQTALMIAVATRANDIVSMLIDAEADISAHNQKGATALMLAVKKRALDSLILLLEVGAEVDAVDNNGQTAFHYAARHGYIAGAEVLLDYGADILAKDAADMGAAALARAMKKKGFLTWLWDVEEAILCEKDEGFFDDCSNPEESRKGKKYDRRDVKPAASDDDDFM